MKATNIVYRVENKHGEGMYTGNHNLNRCEAYQEYRYPDEVTFDHTRHPCPSNKMIDMSCNGHLFAFESLQSLDRWLFEESWHHYLEKHGYEICGYLVGSVYKEDNRQCLFNPDEAEIISLHKFSELKKILKP